MVSDILLFIVGLVIGAGSVTAAIYLWSAYYIDDSFGEKNG